MKRAIFKEIFVCSFFCFFFVFLTLFLCICYNQKRKQNANIPTKLLIHNNNTRTLLIRNSKQHIFTNLKNKIHNNTATTTFQQQSPISHHHNHQPTNHCHLQFDRKKQNKNSKKPQKLASSTNHITGHYKWNSSIAAQLQSGGYYQLSPAAAPTTTSVITANISITTATSTYAYNQ